MQAITPPSPTTTCGNKATDSTIDELANLSLCSSSNHSMTQASSERDSEDYYADVGFMFDGVQNSTLKRFVWGATEASNPPVRVALHVVDDNPGALQSGHYLWPAAPALAEYLMEGSIQNRTLKSARNVLELGAGTALLSLFSLQLMHDSLQCLVITDHDPGTLERARDSYETTMEDMLEKSLTEEEQFDCINGLGSVPIMFEALEWGDVERAQEVARAAADHSSPLIFQGAVAGEPAGVTDLLCQHLNPNYNEECNIFDLLLGSDLIYAESVVRPLFLSVSYFLAPGGAFLLSQSMKYDDITERRIDEMCQSLNLQRTILKDTLEKEAAGKGARIQQFTWTTSFEQETLDQVVGQKN
jgi:predicted nicotinamide N-methyase